MLSRACLTLSELSLSLPQQGFWDLIAMVNYLGKLVDRLSSWDAGCLILSMANFTLVSSLRHLLPLKVTVLTQSEHFPEFIGLATVRAGFWCTIWLSLVGAGVSTSAFWYMISCHFSLTSHLCRGLCPEQPNSLFLPLGHCSCCPFHWSFVQLRKVFQTHRFSWVAQRTPVFPTQSSSCLMLTTL